MFSNLRSQYTRELITRGVSILSKKFIDISVPMDVNSKEPNPPEIIYRKHDETVESAAKAFGIEPSEWPEGKAWASEVVTLTTHTGTHVDAPWHYWYKTGGQPAKTIDQLPLDRFYGDGVVLNFNWKKAGESISKQDLLEELARINYTLKPGDIVLIRTDCDKKLYSPEYPFIHPGMSAEGTRYLIECGVKVMGTDGYGWDVPFEVHGKRFKETGDPNVLWESHYVGKELEYSQIEKLANLDQIPNPTGFTVIAFPINIMGAGGAWVRAVAVIDE